METAPPMLPELVKVRLLKPAALPVMVPALVIVPE